MRSQISILVAILAGCSGGGHQIAIGPPPARQTTGLFAGGLCNAQRCTCREANAPGDGGVGVPTNGTKRFEIRLGPSPHELWATYKDMVFYKSAERAEECFYVDLPTGDQPFTLRASNPDGVSAAFSIAELGTKTKAWYDTFKFNCGSPGVCSFDELDAVKTEYGSMKHRVRDQCGSVKIRGLNWDKSAAPDQIHPTDVIAHVTLAIYKYAPWKQPGDPTCGEPGPGAKPPADTGPPPAGDEPAP